MNNKDKKEKIKIKIKRLCQDLSIFQEIIYLNILPWKLCNISKMAMKDEYNKMFNENISLEQFNQAKAIKLYSQLNYDTLQKIKKLEKELKKYDNI